MTKLINLTPHAIMMVNEEGENILTIDPSGNVARVKQETEKLGVVNVEGVKILLTSNTYGDVEELPEEQLDNTLFIVSALVASAGKALGRTDLVIPNETVRNDKGQIIGCKSLGKI